MNETMGWWTALGAASAMVAVGVIGLAALAAGETKPSAAAAAGREKSKVCAGCHGPKGISDNPIYPHLAAQQEQYLFQSMKAYRDGGRKDPQMSPMVENLSDQDLRDLAAFYSAQPCDRP